MEIQTKHADATNRQLLILSKNAEVSARSLESTIANNLYGNFQAAMTELAKAQTATNRAIAIMLIGQAAREDERFISSALMALETFARAISPVGRLTDERITVLPSSDIETISEKIEALKKLPLAYWMYNKAPFGLGDIHGFLQSLDSSRADLESKDWKEKESAVQAIWTYVHNLHPSINLGFWYDQFCKPEIQAMIDVLEEIKRAHPMLSPLLSRMNLDGYDFTGKNFSHSYLTGSSLRGTKCYETVFANAYAVNCDFTASFSPRANFAHADLRYSDFTASNLEGAIFRDADISGCLFINCVGINDSQLHDARNFKEAKIT